MIPTNTDVSSITDLPGRDGEPDDLCKEGEHVFYRDDLGYKWCRECDRSLQTITDWHGHDTGRSA